MRSRRGPGSCGAAAAAPRGCPPSARDRRAPPRQPNVNLGATRARTRPATRRAPLRPVWRHGRRWRGERRPSWCYRFATEPRATCRSHVLNLLAYREGSARRGASPGSARRDLSAGTVGLSLPSCTSALARAAADSFPEASRRGTRRQEHSNHDTGLTTQLGRRNEEGPLFHETSVFRPLGSHRRVHSFRREAARRVGVEGPHQS